MQEKNRFRLSRQQKKRYKAWAKKQLELYPYESWVEGGNLNEEQLAVVRNEIENFQSIAKYGYVKTVKIKP